MTEIKEICRLDYLYGTLATAYKGIVTSLAAKSFCMLQQGTSITITGTILAMPEGDYESRLIREGNELARCAIKDGFFQFTVNESLIKEDRNLQIDIIQKGRHVGSFLLKREKPDEFYTSAIELADELKNFEPHSLVARIQDRPGLLKKAEGIISIIISPKRDWRKLSEEINSFAGDLFWADGDAFGEWYPVLTKWSARASTIYPKPDSGRTVVNFFRLAELPLENIADLKARPLLIAWLDALQSAGVDLSFNPRQFANIADKINRRFPEIDIKTVMLLLLKALRERLANAPVIGADVPEDVRKVITSSVAASIERYSDGNRAVSEARLDEAESSIAQRRFSDALRSIDDIIAVIPDDSELVELLFAAAKHYAAAESTFLAADIFRIILRTFPRLSTDASRAALLNSAQLINIFIERNMLDACAAVMAEVDKTSEDFREGLLLRPDVAVSIIRSGDVRLIGQYEACIIKLSVPPPRVSGFSSDTWAEIADPRHIDRLSRLLAILGAGGGGFQALLVSLLCNLYVSGVFIQDDILFQRNISAYLNSGAPTDDFLVNYILLKKLPVYFNEVGAANVIRDDTTEIDSWANDMTLYFLRKQVHVNSSNYNVGLVEAIINAWVHNDRSFLLGAVPDDVYEKADAGLIHQYSQAIKPLFDALNILAEDSLHLDRLLLIPFGDIERTLSDISSTDKKLSGETARKILLICRIYREIAKKYALSGGASAEPNAIERLALDMDRIWPLRKVLLSPDRTMPEESLYFKRHIAFGIPSVLGTYHEAKFDAFSEMLRTENRMTIAFEELISETGGPQTGLDEKEFNRCLQCLHVMNELCRSHGMDNFQITEALLIIRTNRLHMTQFIDILRVIQKEITWMVDSLTRRIHSPLRNFIMSCPKEDLAGYLKTAGTANADYADKVSDVIIRGMISSIAGFTEMDRLLETIIKRCYFGLDREGDSLLNPHAGEVISPAAFFDLQALSNKDAMQLAPAIGGKAKNLVYLLNGKLRVPHAVVLPAQNTFDYKEYTESRVFADSITEAVRNIEASTGLRYGDPQRPLFLSVRSGSYISMPGILSSILYCGINSTTLDGFASYTGDLLLALDSYRRFIYHYATVVFGMEETIFSRINADMLAQRPAATMSDLSSEDMSRIVTSYMKELTAGGLTLPEDVYEQLREAAKAVYKSWYGKKALQFRVAMQMSEHWGTAVMIMQMVSGNRKGSGASVFFTRMPSSMDKGVYGDTRESATGDDLVHGGLISRPLSKAQAPDGRQSLEETDPELYAMHLNLADRIESSMGGLPQEVEATYVTDADGNRMIYTLQTRRLEFHRGFIKHFQDICRMDAGIIGRGVGVHGGALSGIGTFSSTPEQVGRIRKETGLPIILLRRTSSTDDVSLMPHIDGIITSTGGATSHAAILAGKFGLSAVVGCTDMEIMVNENGQQFAQIGSYTVSEQSPLSLDGSTGLIYSGVCSFTSET
ncbi:MAG TPA: PEP/pyruvate-binding domain-containing protein [Dissulfurispiraceae bacterium]|nr:PEP/pyruvate-binding domain-containing protein [Dissulfurispiraceae bacterium]